MSRTENTGQMTVRSYRNWRLFWPSVLFIEAQETRQEGAMPGDQIVDSLHDPSQRPSPKQSGSTAVSERGENIETRLPSLQETAIGTAHVQGSLVVMVQFGRHGRRR